MSTWYTSAETAALESGYPASPSIVLTVRANGGTVEIQAFDSNGTPFTPADAENTISTDAQRVIERANAPAGQIIATGAAEFQITDNG